MTIHRETTQNGTPATPWVLYDATGLPLAAFETRGEAGCFGRYVRQHPGAKYPPPGLGIRNYVSYGTGVGA